MRLRFRRLLAVALTVLLSGSVVSALALPAGASTLINVGHDDLVPSCTPTTIWYISDDTTCGAGAVSFVTGPGVAPLGTGSARLSTALTTDRSLLGNFDPAYANLRFDSFTKLQYSTYRSSVDAGNNLAIALQFNVDYDITDATTSGQGRAVFEPYQTFPGGIPQNTWQTWNALTGKWWGSSATPKVANATVAQACPQSSPCTWANFLAAYPNAGMRLAPNNGFLFKAGNTWPGFVGNVDAFTFGVNGVDTTYNFDPITCTTDCYADPAGNDANSGFANDPFKTVQKAIDTVSAGGTVHVAAGTYDERVTVNKSITLLGAQAGVDARVRSGGESILAPPDVSPAGQTPLWISANDVTVDGFTVQGNTYGALVGAGVYLQPHSHGTQFVDNIVRNNIVGLFLANNNGADPTLIQHDLFADNTNPGSATGNDIYADNFTAGGAITGATVDSNKFTNSSFTDGGIAVDLENTTTPTQFSAITVSNNTIDNHGKGVLLMGTSNSSVTGNNYTPGVTNHYGVKVWDGTPTYSVTNSNISISHNTLGCAISCAGTGVYVLDPAATAITANRNDLQGLAPGISSSATAGVDGTCNWWGAATGPGVGAIAGSGPVTAPEWLTSNDLSGSCAQAPVVTLATDNAPDGSAGWFRTGPVTGTVTADDTSTGGSNITSIDCNVATVPSGIGTPTATATFAISTEGTTGISCTATDATGSTSDAANLTVKLDTIAPIGSVTINGGGTSTANPQTTIGLSATDNIGVTALRFTNGADCSAAPDELVPSTTSLSTARSLTLPAGAGVKTVCAQFHDEAGNVSTVVTDTIALLTVVQVATGSNHTCARLTDGTAQCWGSNAYGQLGDGTHTTSATGVVVKNTAGTASLTGIIDISAGSFHTCALLNDGTARCWGENVNGQLGDGTMTNRALPVMVKNAAGTGALTGITQLSLAVVYSCARLSNATMRCWGGNGAGNLGDGTMTNRLLPVVVMNGAGTAALTGVAQMSVRGIHSCALITDGTARCWGDNSAGKLGDGTTTNRALPVMVENAAGTAALAGVTQISAGTAHTCARISDGTARCWGSNTYGQLGDGSTTNRLLPVTVKSTSGTGFLLAITTLVAGGNDTCARLSNGTGDCWGLNTSGQLGDGTLTNRAHPVAVKDAGGSSALTGVAQISPRDVHSCTASTDGTARCWGANTFGQLGDGTTTTRHLPVVAVLS